MGLYRITLNKDQVEFLSRLPEQGMGYHIVDLTLIDGTKLKGKMIFNCMYLELAEGESIPVDNIREIEIHKD
jgi:hypothetical protein